jgi:hypothetical protein
VSMSKVMHQMSARAERVEVGLGEAQSDFISDETCGTTHESEGTGLNLNSSNRLVRTRMLGGVAGAQS